MGYVIFCRSLAIGRLSLMTVKFICQLLSRCAALEALSLKPRRSQIEYDYYKSISNKAGVVEQTNILTRDGHPVTYKITLLESESDDVEADPVLELDRKIFGTFWCTDESLGGGSHGTIFKALPTGDDGIDLWPSGTPVAVKRFEAKEQRGTRQWNKNALNEILMIQHLNAGGGHDNISKFVGFANFRYREYDEDDGSNRYFLQHFMVTELVHGFDLHEIIFNAHHIFDVMKVVPKVVPLFEQILLGVEHMHNLDIAHLDLKASNIMVTMDAKRVVIVDFGFSHHGEYSDNFLKSGSGYYRAPETGPIVPLGDDHYSLINTEFMSSHMKFKTKPVDIFALGVLLLFMLISDYTKPLPFDFGAEAQAAAEIAKRAQKLITSFWAEFQGHYGDERQEECVKSHISDTRHRIRASLKNFEKHLDLFRIPVQLFKFACKMLHPAPSERPTISQVATSWRELHPLHFIKVSDGIDVNMYDNFLMFGLRYSAEDLTKHEKHADIYSESTVSLFKALHMQQTLRGGNSVGAIDRTKLVKSSAWGRGCNSDQELTEHLSRGVVTRWASRTRSNTVGACIGMRDERKFRKRSRLSRFDPDYEGPLEYGSTDQEPPSAEA